MAAKRATKATTRRTRVTTQPVEPPQQNFLQRIWANQTQLSFLLGALVVVIVAILLYQYFGQPTTPPALRTSSEPTPIESVTVLTPIPSQQPLASPNNLPSDVMNNQTRRYTVKPGDTLWHIAEQTYGTGFAWKEIAKANNVADPSQLGAGMELNLPKVDTANLPQSTQQVTERQSQGHFPTTYTVVYGDSLWKIAVTYYGDGFKWTKIAEANNLANPSIIHSGNVLSIPAP